MQDFNFKYLYTIVGLYLYFSKYLNIFLLLALIVCYVVKSVKLVFSQDLEHVFLLKWEFWPVNKKK